MELKDVPGIGDKTLTSFAKAGIATIPELLHTFPRTYRTYHASTTKTAQVGDWIVLKGTLSRPVSMHTFRTTVQSSTFWDLDGSLTLRWFNMPYLSRSISSTGQYLVKGQLTEFAGRKQLVAPQLTKVEPEYALTDETVPIYSSASGIKPWVFRQKISEALSHIEPLADPIPDQIIRTFDLIPYFEALKSIHHPLSPTDLEDAMRRLSFQELYNLQLASLKESSLKTIPGIPLTVSHQKIAAFLESLPFDPTDSQHKAIAEIVEDLGKPRAMQRLLQGEVGSGKTLIAIASAIATVSAGYRTLVMAPTQILALQLYENFRRACEPLGITVSLITAKSKGKTETDIVVGTQAVLNLDIPKIGLVIIDEQHRFGVDQRDSLTKKGMTPHLLQMTATPIPRSLAQTVFHQMAVTTLTEVPKNRLPVKTFLVPEGKRRSSYDWIEKEVAAHSSQVFIVVPLIEQAEENDTTPLKSLKELEKSMKEYFPDLSVDVMHGKMSEKEKVEHMTAFKNGITHILVATSMIEVGIDIPDANIIVIEDADRFGLAQLHQLRGRVGRGGGQGYCLLFSQGKSTKSRDRLSFFIRESHGDKLAQYDLEVRGPGELFGTMQSGFFRLNFGSIYDEKLLAETYEAAKLTLQLDKTIKTP